MKSWKDICLYDLLTYGGEEYHKLMSSMLCDDFFILQDRVYDFVDEIRSDDNQLIGFASGSLVDDGVVLLELFYLLPLFRGEVYFSNYLEFITGRCRCVLLDRPNHYSVLSLIRNGFAEMISDSIVHSFYPLSFEDYETNERLVSYFYDLRLSAIIDFENEKISPLQEVDIHCFNAHNGREKFFVNNYFEETKIFINDKL